MTKTFTAALKAIGMTRWFIVTSWGYIVTKSFSSKVEYFAGLIPAWGRFTVAMYKEFKKAEQ
jgi:hypothetical protein